MRLRSVWVGTLGFVLAAAFACGGGSESGTGTSIEQAAPAGAPAAAGGGGGGQKVDPATAGDIKGVVTLDGEAPKNAAIKMNADPVCVKENTEPQFQETIVAEGGKLANVFVYVKDGLGNYVYDPPTDSPTIDQKACRYHPHVFGIRVGQTLTIVNSDPTLHNIHAVPKANAEFNNGQPIQGMKMTHVFDKPEMMVPFKCDVHGWMNAYIGVLDHPYFAVTGADGSFSLKGLPPGTYTIEAWHEKLGTQETKITLGAKESKDANFTFKASAATD